MQVKALQSRVSPDTESEFDDAFWSGLDLVVNALDNVSLDCYFLALTDAAGCTVWCAMALPATRAAEPSCSGRRGPQTANPDPLCSALNTGIPEISGAVMPCTILRCWPQGVLGPRVGLALARCCPAVLWRICVTEAKGKVPDLLSGTRLLLHRTCRSHFAA